MSFLNKVDLGFRRRESANTEASVKGDDPEHPVITDSQSVEKDFGSVPSKIGSADEGPNAPPDPDAQRGVQKIEAVTSAWSKWSLVALLVKYISHVPLY